MNNCQLARRNLEEARKLREIRARQLGKAAAAAEDESPKGSA